jgi:hypothetical protein
VILHSALATGLIGTLLSLLACVALRRRGRPRLLAAILGPAFSFTAQLVLASLAIGIAVAPRAAIDAILFATPQQLLLHLPILLALLAWAALPRRAA